jgi:iron complex outermembrane receptor protein
MDGQSNRNLHPGVQKNCWSVIKVIFTSYVGDWSLQRFFWHSPFRWLFFLAVLFIPDAIKPLSAKSPIAQTPNLPPWEVVVFSDPLGLPAVPLLHAIPLGSDAPSLRSLFRRVPGLLVQESFGGVDPPRLSARGSGIQSAPLSRGLFIHFNGLPINLADGSFNLAVIENAWLDQAQFMAGPATGVPSLGGGLALWTKGGRFESSRHLRFGAGTDATWFVQPQVIESVPTGTMAFEGGFMGTDGWRKHSAQRRESIWCGWRYQVSTHTQLDFQIYAARPRFEVPGPLSKSVALNDPKSNFARVRIDRPERISEYLRVGTTLRHETSEGLVALSLFGIYYGDDFRQLLPNGISRSESLEAGLMLDVVRENTANWEGVSRLHMHWQSARGSSQRFTTVGGQRGVLIGDNALRPDSFNLRFGQQFAIGDRHQLDLGLTTVAAKREIKERFSGRPSTALSKSNIKIAPSMAWTFELNDAWKMVVSYARGYEPPTFADLLFTEFNPPPPQPTLRSQSLAWQRADSIEMRLQGGNERLSMTTGPYYAWWKDEWLRLVDGNGAPLGTVNAKKTTHAGWETAVSWLVHSDAIQQWTLWLNHQYLNVRFKDDVVYANQRLGGIPPHSGAIGLRGDFIGGWFIAPELFGQTGKTYADHANTLYSGGFGIWNLDAGRQHPSGWMMGVRVFNIFDRRSIASTAGVLDRASMGANQPIFLPTSGRRLEIRFEYTW